MLIKYSIFKYFPFGKDKDSIILGILLCSEDNTYKEFKYLKDLLILEEFKNEVSISSIDKLLKGIEEDIIISKMFDIDDYIKYFLNDFYFEKSKTIDLNIEKVKDTDFSDLIKILG